MFGGRGSGKSHFFGELLVETCQAERGTLAVCIREAQRALAQSSKRLIESKIAALGLGHQFRIYSDKIETPGDGLIIFRGMQSYTFKAVITIIVTGFVGRRVCSASRSVLGKVVPNVSCRACQVNSKLFRHRIRPRVRCRNFRRFGAMSRNNLWRDRSEGRLWCCSNSQRLSCRVPSRGVRGRSSMRGADAAESRVRATRSSSVISPASVTQPTRDRC